MIITHIPDEITDYFLVTMNDLQKTLQPTHHNNALTTPVWWSENIISMAEDKDGPFCKNINYLKNVAEKVFHCGLVYYYTHFIDYTEGGSMEFHSHEHTEDYVFILYLNDCIDGETNFYLKDIVSLRPKKSQVVFFESHIKHSSSLSHNKKILVGGMKRV